MPSLAINLMALVTFLAQYRFFDGGCDRRCRARTSQRKHKCIFTVLKSIARTEGRMRVPPRMNVWAHKDAIQDLQDKLEEHDVAQLRVTCKDWQGIIDSTLSKLVPLNLDCPLLASRSLPGLKSLQLTQLHHLRPQQLLQCTSLTQLTQLHIGGTACCRLRTHHMAWISRLTNLQDLSISKCGKVKLNVLSCWHTVTKIQTLTLIGLSVNPTDTNHLNPFLAAGAAHHLTALVLGDHQGLSFLSDRAVEGLGDLLGPVGKIRVLDLSGCIELTDAGIRHLSGLTSLEHLSLHNCMKIGTAATQTLATFTALKTLNLRGCSQLTDAQVCPLLSTLTRLEMLNLQGCSGLVGNCFSPVVCKRLLQLKTLNLSYCQGLGIITFQGLVLSSQLQVIDLTGCQVVSGLEILGALEKLTQLTSLQAGHWRCKGAAAIVTSNGSSSSTNPALLPANLQHLNLSHLSCSEAFIITLISQFSKTLTYLDLSQCSGFGPASGFRCLEGLSHLQSLQVLKLSSGLGGIPSCALGFISGLTKLRDLQLEYVHDAAGVGDDSLSVPVDSSSSNRTAIWLQELTSSASNSSSSSSSTIGNSVANDSSKLSPAAKGDGLGCSSTVAVATDKGARYQRPVAGVNQLLLGAADSSLMSSSSCCSDTFRSTKYMPQSEVRRVLFSTHPAFSSAHSSSSSKSDVQPLEQQPQQQHWLQQLQQLQNLSVTFSPWMTDTHVEHLSGLSCLTSLSLIACQNLTGSGFQAWTSSRSSSSKPDQAADLIQGSVQNPTPSLMQLNLTGCGGLTDLGLAAIAVACPRLKKLLLPGCRGVADEGLIQLKELSRLQVLDLASNRSITARSINALFPALLALRSLSLSMCGSICDSALPAIAAASALTAADLRGCWQITDTGVHELLQNSKSLLHLNIDSCHRLSNRCCPDTFRPGGLPLPATGSSNSSGSGGGRPSLLIRVAMSSFSAGKSSRSNGCDCSCTVDDSGDLGSADGVESIKAAAVGPGSTPGHLTGSGRLQGMQEAETFGMSDLQQALPQCSV